MNNLVSTVSIALRLLRQRPGLTVARGLTVVIVVCAVSAVFAVANATLLRPLPFPEPDALVRVYMQPPGTNTLATGTPLYDFVFDRMRTSSRSVEALEAVWAEDRALAGDGDPESVRGGRASDGFFRILGGEPALGRAFAAHEVETGARVVVLSDGLWRRRYGGDPAVIGRTILIDREPYAVIGVTPQGFEPAFSRTEFWTPFTIVRGAKPVMFTGAQTIARLRPGVSAQHVRDELESLLTGIKADTPLVTAAWVMGVVDLREAQYGSRRPAILMLLAAVAALALIAIGNLANLTLADVMFRRSDFALRAVLGASRLQLAGPEISQSLVVAVVGGSLGLIGAAWLVPPLLAADPTAALVGLQGRVDWRVAVGGMLVACSVMLASVAVPVLRLASPNLASEVASGSTRTSGSQRARRTRLTLVAVQAALTLVLLSSGALVVTAFQGLSHVDPGFDPTNVLTAQLQLSGTVFPTPQDRAVVVDNILTRLKATPGIVNAATTLNPFNGGSFTTVVTIEDRPADDGEGYSVQFRRVSPGYFETLGIPIKRGRGFEPQDGIDRQLVAVVSEKFASRFWPDGEALGRRLRRGSSAADWAVVVGVVGDVRDVSAGSAEVETIYTAYAQGNSPAVPVALVVRTAGDPLAFIPQVKRAVWDVDPKQPLANIVTTDTFLSATIGQQRFRAIIISICGVLGLALATIGTYGVTARAVVERTREVGIRLALGGHPGGVWWTVAWSSLQAVLYGTVAGIAFCGLARQGLAALLPEVQQPIWTYSAISAMGLLGIGALAALIAARAVTRIAPLHALRRESA